MIYAGFWRRAVAFIVDMLIVAIPTTLVFGPMIALEAFTLNVTPNNLSATQGQDHLHMLLQHP